MLQLFQPELDASAAATAARALATDAPEVRVDEYMALPPPLGWSIGIKARGGKKKVEAKVVAPPPPLASAGRGSPTTALDDWQKHTTKINGGIDHPLEVAAWLQAAVPHPSATWAAAQITAGHFTAVSVTKSRQGCMLPGQNAFLEQTDVAVSLLRRGSAPAQPVDAVLVFRSWAVEGPSPSAFLLAVSSRWGQRVDAMLASTDASMAKAQEAPTTGDAAVVIVDGYPGFAHAAAARLLSA
jgi:hypothetical protein